MVARPDRPDLAVLLIAPALGRIGILGQGKLLSLSVLVVGAGGIGSTLPLFLAASSVVHITIVDHDTVEVSNLHRHRVCIIFI